MLSRTGALLEPTASRHRDEATGNTTAEDLALEVTSIDARSDVSTTGKRFCQHGSCSVPCPDPATPGSLSRVREVHPRQEPGDEDMGCGRA